MRINGIIAEIPMILVVFAERRMPPSWMSLTASMSTAPSTKVAFILSVSPVFSMPRSNNVNCHVLMTESGANKPLRM